MKEEIEELLASHDWSEETRDKYRRTIGLFVDEVSNPKEIGAVGLKEWLESHPWSASTRYYAFYAIKHWLTYKFGAHHRLLTSQRINDNLSVLPGQSDVRLSERRCV